MSARKKVADDNNCYRIEKKLHEKVVIIENKFPHRSRNVLHTEKFRSRSFKVAKVTSLDDFVTVSVTTKS